jgi:hypothetical protein
MTTAASSPALAVGNSRAFPRSWMIVYWVATVFVAGNAAVAGTMDILRLQPLFGILLHLGFPAYFGTILGMWKVLGAAALLAPRRPLLKEWAYAGMFFDFSAALVAHAWAGDGIASFIGPVFSVSALVASWYLRPQPRRLAGTFVRA